jgi:hypothetical protein
VSDVTSNQIKAALAKKHGDREFFMTEVKNGPSGVGPGELLQFDAVAIYKSWSHPQIRGYEVKVSRSDFLRDIKYSQYLPYFHEFYFVVPAGMVQRQEVEENIGLMWYNPETGALTTKKKAVWRNIEIDALMLLYVIMYRLDSDRLPFYSSQAEYWREWLEGKRSDRELGYQVRSKLVTRINELEQENKRYSNFKEDREEHGQIVNVMRKHGLSTWGNVAETLDAALSRPYPAELDAIRAQLAGSILSIDKLKEKPEVAP